MYIKPDEFEKKWELIINEFNLEDKRWFYDKFELRDKWILAYFSDTRMSGLMKTTSRLESMNSFFNTYSQSINLLLHFMMNYDTTIQKQRNTQQELDNQTKKAYRKKSIKVPGTANTNMLEQKMMELYKVEQLNKNKIKLPTNDVKCTCEHFNCFGTLCRHAFNILMKHVIKEILEEYIKDRWRKDVISRHYHFGRHKTKSMLKEYKNNPTNELQKNRIDVEDVGKLMGISIPKDIDINVPNVQSNKRSGKKSRIQSVTEITYKNLNKKTRRCSGCGERAPHNLRTCPIKLAAEQISKAI
ncbi:protein FAR-RED ELONGATED HYPOCOTYL 3-like [Lactuca sativa]|uniref:protein FAR-RED ELONGATED HYPOCOTYL 3-like n=1 Tax=Lactuca sativa TaxID=4236 RepID=UPI001C68F142|nr:protein FAR-RED ELONGATED HYPOCOTYL 3-like [Lactuca sativa]